MFIALFVLVYLVAGASTPPSPFALILSSNWEDRYDGAKMLVANHPLSDPAIQSILIKLFERESADPKWEDLDELLPYEDYYNELLFGTVQKIATTYHSKVAFYALTHANYNADSEFGRWLATQPEALPILLAQTKDESNCLLNDVAHQVLAFAISFCPPDNQKPTCDYVNKQRDTLMNHFRTLARDFGNEDHWVTGIVCLSICGTTNDLAWMKETAVAANPKVRGFLPLFIENLEERLGLPITPRPPVSPPPQTAH